MNLSKKNIVLTGASGGIGRALAVELAKAGGCLILSGRNENKLQQTLELLERREDHYIVAGDITKQEDRERLLGFCQNLSNSVQLLINNAGIGDFSLLENCEAVNFVLDTNLQAPILLTQLFLPLLKQQEEAVILNIGSTLASVGYPGYTTYCASKFGLFGFSEALRRELSDSNVCVLYAAPRTTATDILSEPEQEFNRILGNPIDSPEYTAGLFCKQLQAKHHRYKINNYVGATASFAVRFNALFPSVVDKAIRQQLVKIKPLLQRK